MKIDYDLRKRDRTLQERGLDMARGLELFVGPHLTFPDIRFEYGENRWMTTGFLDARMVVMTWTTRAKATRVISLRKANEREQKSYRSRMG